MSFQTKRQATILLGIAALTACTRQVGTEGFRTQFLPVAPKPVVYDIAKSMEAVAEPKLSPRVPLKEVPNFLAAAPKPAARLTMESRVRLADVRFQEGRRLYQSGDFGSARTEFDAAIDILLTVPDSTPDRALVAKKLEDLADRIHRMDIEGLGAGDTQQSAVYERSPLQEILEMTFPINPEIKTKVHDQIQVTTSQIPLDENDAVLRYINYFSTAGKGTIIEGLRRSGRYRPMIQKILAEEGVPQELIFLAQAESGFQARAVSYKAAAGMWQFIQPRGVQYGLKRTAFYDERLDPEKATRAGARHLKDLYKMFGDWYLAMAAYNCGPGCVSRAVERTGHADFWQLRSRNVLPQETANYVPLIVAMTIVAKNLKEYGIDEVTMEPALEFERVLMTANTSMQLAADLSDISAARMREMNPSLLTAIVPAGFELKVPVEAKDSLSAALLMIPPEKRCAWRTHRVSEGETPATIARRYGIQPAQVAPLKRGVGEDLKAGDLVIIQAAAWVPPPPARVVTPQRKYTSSARLPGQAKARVKASLFTKGHTLAASSSQRKAAAVRRGGYASRAGRSRSASAR